MGAKMFFGILLLALGLSILINVIFKVNIPIFRVLLGIFVIYLGIKIIAGPRIKTVFHSKHSENVALFDTKNFRADFKPGAASRSYSVVFGQGNVDLRSLETTDDVVRVEISVVFGNSTIFIPSNLPIEMEINSVAAQVSSPQDLRVESAPLTQPKKLVLEINAVFAAVTVLRDSASPPGETENE